MLRAMEDANSGKAGRALWTLASVLLLLVWLASMSLDDDRLCNAVPLCMGLTGVLLLGIAGVVVGGRPARPTFTCLLGLGAGGYFLIRCLAGDMLSENWRELPLILAAFVFYGAGYFMAPRRGSSALMLALLLGVLANVAYLFLLGDSELPPEVKGRPSMSLAGPNRPGWALFGYGNFAAMFLMIAGFALLCRPVWAGWKGWGSFLLALVGLLGMVCSCLCEARSVLALPPLMLVIAWGLWVIIRLYTSKGAGPGVVISGLLLFVGIGVLLGELFMGNDLLRSIISVDTHGRTGLWAQLYTLLPEVPWCGHGPGGSTWHLVPILTDWALPNYAHNEYLQAWVDYGVVGVALLLAVLLSHLASGFWSLASEDISRSRRALVAACMFLLLSFAACAMFDFVWHGMALTSLAAFACGALAAPVPSRREFFFSRRKWAPGCGPSLRPVRLLGQSGAAICCVGLLALALLSGGLAWRLFPAWQAQWEYNALWHAGASEGERAAFLERVMPFFPDPELVDHYVTLQPPPGRGKDEELHVKEMMLHMALKSNPHQLFTVVMLADVLGRDGRYAEAESLMRDNYVRGGQPRSAFANWPGYYGMNLLKWGQDKMVRGDHAAALSMMEYALNICSHSGGFRYNAPTVRRVADLRNKFSEAYIAARRVDVDTLRAIGVQKDDSWKQALRPGGPPALYQAWGKEPGTGKYANPYGKRSPLKL